MRCRRSRRRPVMCAAAAWVSKAADTRLVSSTRRQSCRDDSSRSSSKIATAKTRMSIRPWRSTVVRTSRSRSASSVTSVGTNKASAPNRAANSSGRPASRSARTTLAPSASEGGGDGRPEIGRRPGDDGDLAVEVSHDSDADALVLLVGLPLRPRRPHLGAIADLGHADLPPGTALRPGIRVDGHDDDVAAVRGLGPGKGRREVRDAARLARRSRPSTRRASRSRPARYRSWRVVASWLLNSAPPELTWRRLMTA